MKPLATTSNLKSFSTHRAAKGEIVTEQIQLSTLGALGMRAATTTAGHNPAQQEHAVFSIRVVEGPAAGGSLAMNAGSGRVLIGTSGACHLLIHQDRSVSRRHAALEMVFAGETPLLKVTDLGSTNGTLVDGTRVIEAYARSGSSIRIGATTVLQVFAEQCEVAPATGDDASPSALASASASASARRFSSATSFGRMIGASAAMRRIYPLLERLAASTTVPVLIEGEAGTGKELLAEVLHENGSRAEDPFIVVDASSSPEADRDLFGGASVFTTDGSSGSSGVTAASSPCFADGAFHRARGGTLLIDHISELSIPTQAKLLRAMSLDPAVNGGPRIIATSRRDLDKEVELGRFREDLYYHLVVGRVELPPLRSRGEDIRLLADFFWRNLGNTPSPWRVSGSPASATEAAMSVKSHHHHHDHHHLDGVPAEFLRRFDGHTWAHNVRELRAAVTRRAALGEIVDRGGGGAGAGAGTRNDDGIVDGAPENAFRWVLEQDLPYQRGKELLVLEFERAFVKRALAAHGGNVSRAAAASGLARRYFQVLRSRVRRR